MATNVVITDYTFLNFSRYEEELHNVGAQLTWPEENCEDRFLDLLHSADALIHENRYLTSDVISRLERCRIIAHHGKGVDNIDIDAATSRGILVTNVLDASMHEVSDHVLSLVLSLARGIFPYDRAMRKSIWHVSSAGLLHRLSCRIIGLVGFGNIARYVARKAQAFGMQVLVYARNPSADLEKQFGVRFVDLATLFSAADFISMHLPLTHDTARIASAPLLRTMKPDAFFINVSRGGLADEAALVDLLSRNAIAGAGLDVMVDEPPQADNPLLHLPNVILTPHCAWYSEEGVEEVERRTAREVARALSGIWPVSIVNPAAKNTFIARFGPMAKE